MADPHRYFIRILDKENKNYVQEVDPRLFSWLQQLPVMDTTVNEPNLLKIERYSEQGLYQSTGQIEAFYAGVVRLPNDALIIQYHYFLNIKSTKLKNYKKQPFIISDFSVTQNLKT